MRYITIYPLILLSLFILTGCHTQDFMYAEIRIGETGAVICDEGILLPASVPGIVTCYQKGSGGNHDSTSISWGLVKEITIKPRSK